MLIATTANPCLDRRKNRRKVLRHLKEIESVAKPRPIEKDDPTKMSFTSIPVLDLSQADSAETKPAFLSELRSALMEVGFLYLKNIGIPDELFAEVIKEGKAFFDIPMEEK